LKCLEVYGPHALDNGHSVTTQSQKKANFDKKKFFKLCNMSTALSAKESDASGYSLSHVSKKRKNAKVESTSAPKRQSQLIASQSSELTVATSQLRLSSSLSSSYDWHLGSK
jgi:hypothetical protein